ncbi:hypothetical protein BGZ94_003158 [Podila epigama]|nr:hypothetical protein BGZ94_003158 [Podila epigama]
MIVPLMILMWLTSALIVWGLIPDLDFIESMVLAACVTPTDPVLSNSVVKGRFAEKHVPPRIRYLLSAESGINDGMGLPFLFLGLYLMRERSVGTAIGKWFYLVWAYQILLSIVLGGVIGAAARKLVKGAKNRNLIDKESFLVFSIALALAVVGCVSILASDDLLACFIAGNVFAWDDWFSNEIAEAHIQEIIDMLLNLACFIYIGASIPFANFHDLTLGLSVWRLIVLAIAILIFRRLPFVVALKAWIPALASHREAAFAGWFGPIGVGAVYFTKVTASMTNPDDLGDNPHNVARLMRVRSVIYPIVMFLVLSSVLIHGITVPLLHLQYKYTRTWSRKRDESSHAVSRLPHINIGDEIVLRPPTVNGSANDLIEHAFLDAASMVEQRSIGYDHQRSIGSLNQRSLGTPGSSYGGLGFSDLAKTTSKTTIRTLEDVVQEMKEATRGRGARSSIFSTPSSPNTHAGGAGGGTQSLTHINSNSSVHGDGGPYSNYGTLKDSVTINLGSPDRTSVNSGFSPNRRIGSAQPQDIVGQPLGMRRNNTDGESKAAMVVESLRESHPASQGLNIIPSFHHEGPASGSLRSASTTASTTLSTAAKSPCFTGSFKCDSLQRDSEQTGHQRRQSLDQRGQESKLPGRPLGHSPGYYPEVRVQEVQREEYNGAIRTVTLPEQEQEQIRQKVEERQQSNYNET